MEPLPPLVSVIRPAGPHTGPLRKQGRPLVLGARILTALPLLVLFLTGCVTTSSFVPASWDKPTGEICQVAAAWVPEVVYTPDPVHGGDSRPGFAGRVYLFGEEVKYPLVGDGTIIVTLYDETKGRAQNKVPLEEWRFDAETLKRLERKDTVGWGYTLFLPWGTYRPDIKQIQLRLRYHKHAGGLPLYAASQPFSLREGNSKVTVRSETRSLANAPTGQPAASASPVLPATSNLANGVVPAR
jgi:hypothetical protein